MDHAEKILQKTSLVPSAWPVISSSIDKLINIVRESRFSKKAEVPPPSGLEDCIEIILSSGELNPGLDQTQIISTRVHEIRRSLEISSYRSINLRPIKVFAPRLDPGSLHVDDKVLKVEFYSNSQELDGLLKRSFLTESCTQPNISLEMSSKGIKETLLLDMHRRFVNLEYVPNQVFSSFRTHSFQGIRLIRQTGKVPKYHSNI